MKKHLIDEHIRNYFNVFHKPITDNEGQAISRKRRQDGAIICHADGKRQIGNNVINYQENSRGGAETRFYWTNLKLKLDELGHAAATTLDNVVESLIAKMKEGRQKRSQLAKCQHDAYSATKDARMRQRKSKEGAKQAFYLFNAQSLQAILITSEQNASAVHVFTKAFCTMAHHRNH